VQTDASTEHCSSAAWADVMSHTHGRIESVSVSLSWCLKFQLNANRVASDRYYFVKRHLNLLPPTRVPSFVAMSSIVAQNEVTCGSATTQT